MDMADVCVQKYITQAKQSHQRTVVKFNDDQTRVAGKRVQSRGIHKSVYRSRLCTTRDAWMSSVNLSYTIWMCMYPYRYIKRRRFDDQRDPLCMSYCTRPP